MQILCLIPFVYKSVLMSQNVSMKRIKPLRGWNAERGWANSRRTNQLSSRLEVTETGRSAWNDQMLGLTHKDTLEPVISLILDKLYLGVCYTATASTYLGMYA